MKIYLAVETKYECGFGGMEERKHLRFASLNEDMADQACLKLKCAKRRFNEPEPSYYIEEINLDEETDILL